MKVNKMYAEVDYKTYISALCGEYISIKHHALYSQIQLSCKGMMFCFNVIEVEKKDDQYYYKLA